MRSRLWIVLGLVAVVPVACATADLGEEDGVKLPDRLDGGDARVEPPIDAGMQAPDVSQPDTSVPVDSSTPHLPRVFVTSTTMNANLGGLAGGDLICTNLAIAAGLVGKWAAWLSVQGGPHATTRIAGTGPWSLVTGEVVATTKAQLVSGALAHPIDKDEKGTLIPTGRVWTGSNASGLYETNDCDKWGTGANGRVGDLTSISATWTTVGVDACNQARRLYCFEL
jgi:hypothetical protein